MKLFIRIICLFCIPRSVLGKGINYGDEISYHDLQKMNASCYPLDSCRVNRDHDPPGISYPYSCSCNRQCWQYGTCCIDSPYRDNAPPVHECRKRGIEEEFGYFMVQRCSDNTGIDSIWKSQCEEEWNGEDDIIMLSPVTSLDTWTTYKNYYCFRCHETTDHFISWNIYLRGNYESSENSDSVYRVTYNRGSRISVANMVEKTFSFPFFLSFEIPFEIQSLAISCDPYIVSDCSENWSDQYVRDKCRAYTSTVSPRNRAFLSYKNIHCAICNYESLGNFSCPQRSFGISAKNLRVNFADLVNINTTEEENCDMKIQGKCLTNFQNQRG